MEVTVLSLLALLSVLPSAYSSSPLPKSRMLYEIACTMCSTCCNPVPASPPPPSPSPPPPSPSPPPPSSVPYCPPPPSKSYYYSPPPPSTYTYSSPPPPQGGGGGYYNYPPPNYYNYPAPPPPNPIVPYFPFYYYNPPPASMSFKLAGGISHILGFPVIGVLLLFI